MQSPPAGPFKPRGHALPNLAARTHEEETVLMAPETKLMAQETKLMPAGVPVPHPAHAAMAHPSAMPGASPFGAPFEWPAAPQAAPYPHPHPHPYPNAPHAPISSAPPAMHHAMQPPPTLPPPSPMPMSPYGQPAYGAAPSYPPPAHQPGAPFGYAQPTPAQATRPSSNPPAYSPAPSFHLGGPLGGTVGGAAMGALSKMPQPAGLPSAVAFGLGIVAVLVALIFDVVFLKVHIPGVGGYAWYLTTALSFAAAGFGGAKWTRASQGTAYTAVAFAGIIYGLADIGLGLVLEDLAMSGALFLGIQGLVIAVVCGGGGVRKGVAAKEDEEA